MLNFFGLPDDISINFFAIAHGAAAGAVTVHALLRKRDVRATIGWIGLAWLSPAIGATLYYILGINRVSRRASRIDRAIPRSGAAATMLGHRPDLPENIAVIARVSERVTRRPLMAGNRVSPLRGGDEAYPEMVAAIKNAQRSVALASYIFRMDEAGRAFVDALAEARARGVEIRVLVDGIGAGYLYSPVVEALTKKGIRIARFFHDWLPWRMPFLNMRSHKKILVIDGTVGFTGGLNIGAENVLALHPAHPVDDVHFRVEGPVVNQLMLAFAEDWNFATGELLDDDNWWPRLAAIGSVLARGISSGPDEDVDKLEAVLASAVAGARRRLRIVTPYFLPEQNLMSAIALASLRGVDVDVVLPERSNHILLDWATRAHFKFFRAPSVELHLTPPPFDHTKLMTVDGHWCFIGSPNWDARSTRLNFEFSLECYSADVTRGIDHIIDEKIARARHVAPPAFAQRSLPLQLRDAAARLLLPYL